MFDSCLRSRSGRLKKTKNTNGPKRKVRNAQAGLWTVYVGDADANPLSKVYRVFSFAKAENLAKAMSNDRKLELVSEAQAA